MTIVKKISFELLLPIRSRILRPGRPIEEAYFPNDTADSTFHLGVFKDEKLVTVASFSEENYNNIPGKAFRLRSMATEPEHRGYGFGKELFKEAEIILKENETDYLWCNARTSAEGFYSKMGMRTISEVFDIPVIGPHIVMLKELF